MDSDDVGQPKLALTHEELLPPPFLFPLSPPFPSLPHQDVDYGSGDEMEDDDGDMFVDEDLDLQAR